MIFITFHENFVVPTNFSTFTVHRVASIRLDGRIQYRSKMDNWNVFKNINKILERDSKSTTYKFALLRAVIDAIQENSPYLRFTGEKIFLPIGLLIEKWLLYYYPLFESDHNIRQIPGTQKLAIESPFLLIIQFYKTRGGFSAFFNDFKFKGIPEALKGQFRKLLEQIHFTMTRYPMKHIGYSISNQEYSIFLPHSASRKKADASIDREWTINSFGEFSIPLEYYEAFRILGSFITGQESIVMKWADYSEMASGRKIGKGTILETLSSSPVEKRDPKTSKEYFKEVLGLEGKVICVWTGKAVSKYVIDHVIAFSAWRNNDLWNLLPAQTTTNGEKSDKVPSEMQLELSRERILHYWSLLEQKHQQRFQKEVQTTLLGNRPYSNWPATAFDQLKSSCAYLIQERGYEPWAAKI
jgi:hypothetical protein